MTIRIALFVTLCSLMLSSANCVIAALTINANPGFSITFDGNDGRFAGTVVPTNLATGTSSFGSSDHPSPVHEIPHVNDGIYGNNNSWLANPGDANPRIGVGMGGLKPVTSIAFGRSNSSSHFDRTAGVYTLQYTTDSTPGLGSSWTSIGTFTMTGQGALGAPGGAFDEYLRHEYSIRQNGNPINATGFRFQNNSDTIAINEIELYSDNQYVAATGPKMWLKADQGVVASGGNISLWGDRTSNANNATATNNPTLVANQINGNPAVNFGGTNQFLSTPTASTLGVQGSDYEILVVAKSSSAAIQFLTGGTTNSNYELHLNGAAGARFIPLNGPGDGTVYADIGTASQFTDGRAHLFSVRVQGNTGIVSVDGVDSADTVISAQNAVNVPVRLGLRGDGSLPFSGSMGEVVVLNRALSAAERTNVERSLLLKWGFVREAEIGGTMNAATNVALAANGATPFAKDVLTPGNANHTIAHLNDGIYGNANSWIGNSGPTFAGVAFNGLQTIDQIAFGRDNNGLLSDRTAGQYTLQYTTVLSPNAATLDSDWTTITAITYNANFVTSQALRHVWEFNPVSATGIRLVLSSSATAIDEIEAYFVPIPEPASCLLATIGLIGLIGLRRRLAR